MCVIMLVSLWYTVNIVIILIFWKTSYILYILYVGHNFKNSLRRHALIADLRTISHALDAYLLMIIPYFV
jgi:hypothetical protein